MTERDPVTPGRQPDRAAAMRRACGGAVAGCLGFVAGFGLALALVRDLGDAPAGGGAGADGLFGVCLLAGFGGATGGAWLGVRAADRAQ